VNNLVVVMAHSHAKGTWERHLPYWEAHDSDILVIGDGCGQLQSKYQEINIGPASSRSYERWRKMVEECYARACDGAAQMFMFYEHDSISLSPVIPHTRGMFGITLAMPNQLGDYTAVRYANAPWRIDGRSIMAMRNKMNEFPDFQEYGTNDRFVPGLAQLCGVPLMPFDPPGFSPPGGTIKPENYADMIRALDCGATMIHGIKDAMTLRVIESWRKGSQDDA
jgi:hypothetical protein